MAVRKKYSSKRIDFYAEHPEERITASCIVYSRLYHELWIIGDCQCLVGVNGCNDTDYEFFDNPKPYESVLANARAEKARQLLSSGEATVESLRRDDVARASIIPQMIESMKRQNIDYSVVDGFKIPRQKVKVYTLTFEPWTVIMASDGYPFLRPTLAASESALSEQLEKDPLNIGLNADAPFLATKAFSEGFTSFDDRTYIRFTI